MQLFPFAINNEHCRHYHHHWHRHWHRHQHQQHRHRYWQWHPTCNSCHQLHQRLKVVTWWQHICILQEEKIEEESNRKLFVEYIKKYLLQGCDDVYWDGSKTNRIHGILFKIWVDKFQRFLHIVEIQISLASIRQYANICIPSP